MYMSYFYYGTIGALSGSVLFHVFDESIKMFRRRVQFEDSYIIFNKGFFIGLGIGLLRAHNNKPFLEYYFTKK